MTDLAHQLEQALGPDQVLADEASRTFYANDVFWQPGILPAAIVRPRSVEEVQRAVRLATASGHAVVPRGGGMSYTKGYLPPHDRCVVVDTRRLDRVTEVRTDDLYVTAEAGCTWASVNASLEGSGLRTGYWGPLSGLNATVGGALSQNSAFFGSGLNGTVADSVLGVSVVLADGQLVTTGSGGRREAQPFTRYGGPDLTGMFLGDNGAFGIKVGATLRLHRRPAESGHLSFGFDSLDKMAAAQVEMARLEVIAESFGIDRAKADHSASVNKLMDGAKALMDVAKAGKSTLAGIKDALGVAAAGTAFLKAHAYTLHLVTEGRTAAERDWNLAALRRIGTAYGVEIENTVPKVMRSKPFGPVRGMLGADGERWVPIHAVFPLSRAAAAIAAHQAYFTGQAEMMRRHGIVLSQMTMTVGNEFFLEPAFYWRDEITALHAAALGDDVVRPWRDRPADPAARQAVIELRRGTQELYASLGGASWQVARDYPYADVLKPETWALARALKQAVDPRGLMNPGSLGL